MKANTRFSAVTRRWFRVIHQATASARQLQRERRHHLEPIATIDLSLALQKPNRFSAIERWDNTGSRRTA